MPAACVAPRYLLLSGAAGPVRFVRLIHGAMQSTALVNAALFTGESVHGNSSVIIENGLIADLVLDGRPTIDGVTEIDLQGRRLAPGFIDIQVNGGGGVLFNDSPTVKDAACDRRSARPIRHHRLSPDADQR